jgi:D-sedoheptulose 7-phosphate isomerase
MATMLLHRIQQHFVEGADLQYQCAQSIGPALELAAGAVLETLTAGGKVLVWGAGASGRLAQVFADHLVGRFERERPELPALALSGGGDGTVPLARQLRALGLPGDVLLLLAALEVGDEVQAALQAAHEREIRVIALAGARAGVLTDWLAEADVLVPVPAARPARVHEAHLVALHAICDAIDVQLLGEEMESEVSEP